MNRELRRAQARREKKMSKKYRMIDADKVKAAVLRNNIEATESEHAQLSVALTTQKALAKLTDQPEAAKSEYENQAENTKARMDQLEKQLDSYYEQLDAIPVASDDEQEPTA